MASYNTKRLFLVGVLVTLISLPYSQAFWGNENKIKTAVHLSSKFELGPGSVGNVYFYNFEFPRGHVALKSFNAELVDEAGNPIPLYETYMHHWALVRYYARKGVEDPNDNKEPHGSDYISGRNSGICQGEVLSQFFGSGSETRKTSTYVRDPYGIEIGNIPAEIPSGFEERWYLNVHAIDVRGVEDKLGCMECWCDLYNVTVDEYGQPLSPDYKGGLLCCYGGTQCRLKQGFEGVRRTLYLKYTVRWVDMDSSVLPVKIYLLDITDTWKRSSNSTGANAEHDCQVEYEVEPCRATGLVDDSCIDSKRISLDMPFSGYVIYGVAHQHTSGFGSALYREDGQLLCSSLPIYGEGEEAGNEAGYVVGMSNCYPKPGSFKISKGETLILESNYSSINHHAGLMGIFHLYVADQLPNPWHALNTVVEAQDNIFLSTVLCVAVALMGVLIVITVAIRHRLKHKSEDGYEAIMM